MEPIMFTPVRLPWLSPKKQQIIRLIKLALNHKISFKPSRGNPGVERKLKNKCLNQLITSGIPSDSSYMLQNLQRKNNISGHAAIK
jgi:hypothetical protein